MNFRIRVILVPLACLCTVPSICRADEPTEKMLEALRERGYYDTAVDYLESLEKSDLSTPEFRSRILYEKAVILIEASRRLRDLKKHESYLDRAEGWLTDYVKTNPPSEMMARSEKLRAQLYYGRGLLYLRLTESDRKKESEKQELRQKARALLLSAADTLEKNRKFIKNEIDNIVIDPANRQRSDEKKKKLYREYVQVRVLLANAKEFLADTYPNGSAEQKKQLESALAEHKENQRKYSAFTQGLLASLGAARCSKRLGNDSQALTYCEEIFQQSDVPAFRSYKKEAALIALEIWSKTQPLPHADIIAKYEPIVNSLDSMEQRQADWLKIQLLLARAFRARAEKYEALPKKDKKARSMINTSNRSAQKIARRVARVSGPTREIARKLLVDWNLTVSQVNETETNITSFSQARTSAIDMMADVEELRLELADLSKKVESAGPIPPENLKTEFANASTALQSKVDDVLERLAFAISLSNNETNRDELANVRYLQTYCKFITGRNYETIVISDHMMKRFPGSDSTRDAAALAVKSYLQLYLAARKADQPNDFEFAQIKKIGELMIGRWPGHSATATSAVILSSLATSRGDIEAAEEYLKAIPEAAPGRVNEELRIGQIYWFRYLNSVRKDKANKEKYLPLLDKAKSILQNSVAKIDTKTLTPTGARGALSLTDIYLETNEIPKAIEQLETATIAPLDLLKQKHPAASSQKFISDTYKTAVRVYMAAMRTDANAAKWVAKAEGVLDGLRQAFQTQDAKTADAKLSRIYIQLARESQSQLARLKSAAEKRDFAEGILKFLDSIQTKSNDVKTLLWAGETLNKVGVEIGESGGQDTAKRLHYKAIDVFEKAKKIGWDNIENANPKKFKVERHIALALAGSGQFSDSIKKYGDLLAKNPALADVQIEAAKVYQKQGDANKDAGMYALALFGGEKRPRPGKRPANVIWGWRTLCKATISKPQNEKFFSESLYNLAYCQLRYGELKQNKKALSTALAEVIKYSDKSADMFGRRAEFNEIAKKLQAGLRQKATGLPPRKPPVRQNPAVKTQTNTNNKKSQK